MARLHIIKIRNRGEINGDVTQTMPTLSMLFATLSHRTSIGNAQMQVRTRRKGRERANRMSEIR